VNLEGERDFEQRRSRWGVNHDGPHPWNSAKRPLRCSIGGEERDWGGGGKSPDPTKTGKAGPLGPVLGSQVCTPEKRAMDLRRLSPRIKGRQTKSQD